MAKTVVITGSTRGIGFGLAQECLKRGCQVVVNGRSSESVQKAVATLEQLFPNTPILGVAGEVNHYEQVQALWDSATQRFGTVDIWINNAGIDIMGQPFWELPFSEIDRIVQTNLMGVMVTSHVVLKGMVRQGSGTLYNMEGFGSNGSMRAGMTSYGTTKYALRYFTKSLQKEVKGKAIGVGTLSPGIVVTDLLTGNYADRPQDWERAKSIFNILADKVETVTPYLTEQVLQNTSLTPSIAWLTTPKIIWRFLTARITNRRVFD